ncbi:MAG: hypothetical protein HC799_17455 [Limnothrix sp. RL_2_0]|nr:hypothetical protein [Limnothrix sp. RL_2_0]
MIAANHGADTSKNKSFEPLETVAFLIRKFQYTQIPADHHLIPNHAPLCFLLWEVEGYQESEHHHGDRPLT